MQIPGVPWHSSYTRISGVAYKHLLKNSRRFFLLRKFLEKEGSRKGRRDERKGRRVKRQCPIGWFTLHMFKTEPVLQYMWQEPKEWSHHLGFPVSELRGNWNQRWVSNCDTSKVGCGCLNSGHLYHITAKWCLPKWGEPSFNLQGIPWGRASFCRWEQHPVLHEGT